MISAQKRERELISLPTRYRRENKEELNSSGSIEKRSIN
jgi:hypothetical protein